ncbi:MAG TPA: adenosylcobinamide-GDP ribazoletransferase [Anaerolineaceae bacterium]|nr:adenosylcobinamide-GDP ribazoletransferase [Anaerolineaceae bacterium]
MKSLLVAIGFLTTIPVPQIGDYEPDALGRSTAWFPVVGLLIGGLVAGAYYGLSFILPASVVAVLTTIVWVALSGGLHLDGLADSFDGLMPSVAREKRLSILKDVHLGAFGVMGLVLALLAKAFLLFSLPKEQLFFAIPLAAATGRWALVLAALQPSARPGGLGDITKQGMRKSNWLLAALQMLVMLAVAVYFGRWQALIAFGVAHLLILWVFVSARKKLGGLTGDIFGLCAELSELAVLTVLCLTVF